MVHRKNRRYHDRIARRYDQVYDTPYWRFYREISWRHLRAFLPDTRPAAAADLGCGTGWFGLRLIKAGFDVTFLDPSGAMLEQCRHATERSGTRGRPVRFLQGELEDLAAVEDRSLDFATAQGDPLSFCRDPLRACQELARILRPGATVVLSVDNRVAGVRLLAETCSKPAPALDLLRSGRTTWLAKNRDEAFPMKMFEPDELAALLKKAGFSCLATIAKTCLVQRDNEKWLEDAEQRRLLLQAEEKVHRLPHYFGLASHLQIAALRL